MPSQRLDPIGANVLTDADEPIVLYGHSDTWKTDPGHRFPRGENRRCGPSSWLKRRHHDTSIPVVRVLLRRSRPYRGCRFRPRRGPIARTTYLTFSSPVALPGVTLAAGTYVFELAEPFGASTVVAVRNETRTKHYFLGFTQRIERPRGLSREASVSFGEAPRDMAKRIVAWYPSDSDSGMKFIYPR